MAKFDIPDEGVSFDEMQKQHYETYPHPGPDFGPPPQGMHYQDPAREHEAGMDQLKQDRERARHE
jgi:hypothetical protein